MTDDTRAVAPIAPADPVIAFSDPARRVATVDLDFPVTVDGKPLSQVVIRRLTTREVEDCVRASIERQKAQPGARIQFPMYFDTDGNPLSEAVIDALDDDDGARIQKAVSDFLPRRFQESAG